MGAKGGDAVETLRGGFRTGLGRMRRGVVLFVVASLLMPAATGWAEGREAATPSPAAATAVGTMLPHDHHADDGSGGTPTAGEQAAADRFADIEAARAGGYVQMMPFWFGDIPAAHFLSLAAATDDQVLDPEHPEGLIYLRTADGRLVLLGAMFVAPTGTGPRVGGPLVEWHTHPELCLGRDAIVPVLASGDCARPSRPIAFEMTHVWLVPNRLGAFAHVLPLEDAAAATGQTVDRLRPVPLVDDAVLQDAVGRVLRLGSGDIGRRAADGQSTAEMAAAQGVSRQTLVGAVDDAVAAELGLAVDGGRNPAAVQRLVARFVAAQTGLFLDLRGKGADAAPETTAFGYPCVRVTCLVPAVAAAGAG